MSSTTTITMEHAMKQAITAAFMAMENNTYDRTLEYKEYIGIMLADLFAILFPHDSAMPAPAPEPTKKAPAKKAKKVDPEPVPAEGPAAAGAGAPVEEEPKKKAPKKAAKKETPAAPADKNIEWSTTWTKNVKPIVRELGLTINITPAKQKEYAAHLNGMSKADYDARTFEEHMRDYLREHNPKPAPSDGGRAAAGDASDDERQEVELTEVEFKGKTYGVDTRDPDALAVYSPGGGKPLGYVGSGDFVGMKVDLE
jgi:hypothetical protein